ncbi:site-specific integrase [Chamaesiphon sp. GL140_3_metabinner_50]|uniref:tyrosine-type recombinase/integrase n=1 Tax=Chamaesiphon sp. GL140_3_metabinner_50 TaxID=2970812 RepID=UPI0026002C49|nr:site-specific integrase [Chamaesiphon sp. GL140_3_metabinner_50]
MAYLNQINNISYTTHHRHQAVITALFNFAIEQDYIQSNPVSNLKRRKPNRADGEHATDENIRYLIPEQLSILDRTVKEDARMSALVKLLHSSGARIAEVLALDLAQINIDARKFQVVGKGNKTRWCFYNEDAAKSLNYYIKYYRHLDCLALFTAEQPFTHIHSRLSYQAAYQSWTKLVSSEIQLQGIRFHDLRHTFATKRVGLMGIEELRALMGHENIQTTLKYSKVTSQRAEQVAQLAFERLSAERE